MKTIKYLSFAALLMCTQIKSQDVSWGPEFKPDDNGHINQIIGKDSKGFFVRRSLNNINGDVSRGTPDLYRLEKYDFKGNQIFSKEVTVTNDKDQTYLLAHTFCMKHNLVTA